ncbi:hypothetical protein [Streptomyces celluloflavus]|uniref:hypothetical protein n=1 Tax=Streptomyces celluloflavus TaxID=58344 RepID=UPI00367DC7CE
MLVEQDDEREATWRGRALNTEEALKAAHTTAGEVLTKVRLVQTNMKKLVRNNSK